MILTFSSEGARLENRMLYLYLTIRNQQLFYGLGLFSSSLQAVEGYFLNQCSSSKLIWRGSVLDLYTQYSVICCLGVFRKSFPEPVALCWSVIPDFSPVFVLEHRYPFPSLPRCYPFSLMYARIVNSG